MRRLVPFLACLAAVASVWGQAAGPTPLDISKIRVPPGFRIEVFARDLPGARFMLFTPSGDLLVSLMGAGQIASVNAAGQVSIVARGLSQPHGLALRGNDLYVAEQRQVRVYRGMDFSRSEVVVSGIPGGGHSTRTIGFGPDGKMYLSVGSSCNLCIEGDARRAAIVRYNVDGSGQEIFGRGLRNSVGLRWHPLTRELWATDNGFDNLGDDVPPEEINIVRQGRDYGWPFCYANRQVNPMPPGPRPEVCPNTEPAALEMEAHSAPLGFDFYTGSRFPLDYCSDAFVAFHGSWNRSTPTGYKVVRIHSRNGTPAQIEDFASGWLEGRLTSGRPVDVLTGPDGSLYISDDMVGVVYRVTYNGALTPPSVNSGGVTSAASFSANTAAASGGLISIFGRNFFGGAFAALALPLPDRTPCFAVTVGGLPAPVLYAGGIQINAQVPAGVSGTVPLVVTTSNGAATAMITVPEASPGIFSLEATGRGAGAIRRSNGVVSAANPARAGDVIEIYATGLGATAEDWPAGAAAPLDRPIATRAVPAVKIGGVAAEVLFSGLAPGFAGLNQVNVRVPAGVAAGAEVPVVLMVSGQTSNTVTIAIQ